MIIMVSNWHIKSDDGPQDLFGILQSLTSQSAYEGFRIILTCTKLSVSGTKANNCHGRNHGIGAFRRATNDEADETESIATDKEPSSSEEIAVGYIGIESAFAIHTAGWAAKPYENKKGA